MLPDSPSRWDTLIKILDPMTPLNADMAAAMVGQQAIDLECAHKGDPEFIPYESTDIGRRFRLGDVLAVMAEAAGESELVLEGRGTISREEAEKAMAHRVGPPAAWFKPEDYPSTEEEARKAKTEGSLLLALLNIGHTPKRGRGRPSNKKADAAARAMGIHVHRMKEFASLGDFVLNAFPDDRWIVAQPLGGRPFDFLDSLLAEDQAPWKTMTLFEYLGAIRAGAIEDKGNQFAEEEAKAIGDNIPPSPA